MSLDIDLVSLVSDFYAYSTDHPGRIALSIILVSVIRRLGWTHRGCYATTRILARSDRFLGALLTFPTLLLETLLLPIGVLVGFRVRRTRDQKNIDGLIDMVGNLATRTQALDERIDGMVETESSEILDTTISVDRVQADLRMMKTRIENLESTASWPTDETRPVRIGPPL